MYRKKNFISLGMSLVLAAGITVTPVTARRREQDLVQIEINSSRFHRWYSF